MACVGWFVLQTAAQLPPSLPWETKEHHRRAPLGSITAGSAGFKSMEPSRTAIQFTNHLSDATVSTNRLTDIGSGVALGDVDGDGWVDIYLCRMDGDNVLYRNQGNWRFEDITTRAGIGCPGQFSTGAALVDIDGDGDLDLFVNSLGGGTRLFLNDGHAVFTEKTDAGFAREFGATSLALADVDGDGDLDLYVSNYRSDTFQDRPAGLNITTRTLPDGSTVIEPRDRMLGLQQPGGGLTGIERGQLDIFYLNRGNGRFAAAPWNVGVFLDEKGEALTEPPTDWGLSVLFRDLNGDGLPDLYVCNDFVHWPDRIWYNAGGKRFQAPPRTTFRNTSLSSMAADVADINRDGLMDLFVADMLSPRRQDRAWQRPDTLEGTVAWPVEDPEFRPEVTRNTLHLARGDGTFAEIAAFAGIAATDWTWSSVFLDVDLDGWEDLLVTTGSNHEVQDMDHQAERGGGQGRTPAERLAGLKKTPRRETPSRAFLNQRNATFRDVSDAWSFNARGVAHGMALGDLDNDGDLDAVVNAMNSAVRILQNTASAPRIGVRLKAAGANTRGISAKIEVLGGPVTQSQEMTAGGRYLSSDDPMRVFATGASTSLEIKVTWRSGRVTRIEQALPNSIYEILEEASTPSPPRTTNAAPVGLFDNISTTLAHHHVDVAFNDFERDPLLPYKLSRLGPAVAVADVDRDGREDLAFSGGSDGRASVFRRTAEGTWTEWITRSLPTANRRDQTALLALPLPENASQLVVAESAWETGRLPTASVQRHVLGAGTTTPMPVSGLFTNQFASALACADMDGDGALDLFIGGAYIPGRYPEHTPSALLRWTTHQWVVTQVFTNLGAVLSATFADMDNDGDSDLLLAGHWSSPRLLRNDRGQFKDVSSEVGLASQTGWWNGIAAGDFDGDGVLDMVVTNWGENWRLDRNGEYNEPVQLFYGDISGTGGTVTLLASLDKELGAAAPWRDRRSVSQVVPGLLDRFPTYQSYAKATLPSMLGDNRAAIKTHAASEFRSVVFLNRTNHFEMRPLPVEAQWAPAFGVVVADLDGDGNEDLLLAQNFFGMDRETARQDAGTGCLLLGNGTGDFRTLTPGAAGISIPGEQRAAAAGDFNEDGRVDLVVTQNNGASQLFQNKGAREGIRVALDAGPGNETGLGSIVRFKFKDHIGPARVVSAGSGFWGQSSPTQIMAAPSTPEAILVQWPGGARQDFPFPANARRIRVSRAGVIVK